MTKKTNPNVAANLDEMRRIRCFEELITQKPNISVTSAYYAGIAVGLMEAHTDAFNLQQSVTAFKGYLTMTKETR